MNTIKSNLSKKFSEFLIQNAGVVLVIFLLTAASIILAKIAQGKKENFANHQAVLANTQATPGDERIRTWVSPEVGSSSECRRVTKVFLAVSYPMSEGYIFQEVPNAIQVIACSPK